MRCDLYTLVCGALVAAALGCHDLQPADALPPEVATSRRACAAGTADSAQAVQVALDALSKRYPFHSVVLRFAYDSGTFRITTMPAPGSNVLDGMAIVRVDSACQVVGLVQTDSA